MKLDDPNHDPSQPLVCKRTIEDQLGLDEVTAARVEEAKALRDNIKAATLESYLRYKGWTDDLKIHREILEWRNAYED